MVGPGPRPGGPRLGKLEHAWAKPTYGSFPFVRVVMNILGVKLYSRHGKLNSKFLFPDLGALALSLALVGLVARGMENECHRSYFHPDWSPTERAMFDSLFWGPILAVLQFPVWGGREVSLPWEVVVAPRA